MSFNVLVAGLESAKLLEIQDKKVIAFFKSQREKFVGELSDLPDPIFEKIKPLLGSTDGWGYIKAISLVGLTIPACCQEAYDFIEKLARQEKELYFLAKNNF
jgi:hypothetical protein